MHVAQLTHVSISVWLWMIRSRMSGLRSSASGGTAVGLVSMHDAQQLSSCSEFELHVAVSIGGSSQASPWTLLRSEADVKMKRRQVRGAFKLVNIAWYASSS